MVRGYVGRRFAGYGLLHNHAGEGYVYRYPLVQYKLLGGTPVLLGLGEGAGVLVEVLPRLDVLELARSRYQVLEVKLVSKRCKVQVSGSPRSYRFVTPWLALNQRNYRRYWQAGRGRKALLNSILVGNILSMCKGLGITVRERLELHSRLESLDVRYKGVFHRSFLGVFRVNFEIPELFGLGKGVSQGFGVVLPSSF